MNSSLALNNILAFTLQIALLVGVGSLVPLLLSLRDPRARLLFWQVLLVTCLALPFVRPWRQEVMSGSTQLATAVIATARAVVAPAAPERRLPPVQQIVLWLLATGFIVRTLLLLVGFTRLAAYRKRGTDVQLPGIPSSVAVLLSADISGPVTFGWRRPAILLPTAFLSLAEEMRGAILSHELLHVARRDWLFTLAEELIRAALWFHPAIWWVIGEIQLAREQTVDRAVIENTGAREPYLDALLLMAGVPAGPMGLASAPMFLRRQHLKLRLIEAMKEVRMTTISKTHLICSLGAALTMIVAACWLATGAFPLAAAPQIVADAPGTSVNMNGTPLLHRSAVTYPASALATGVEGTVVVQIKVDANGEVSDATVLSGPEELRGAAQQSVLTWHFDKAAALTTRVVNIDFTASAATTDQALLARGITQNAHGEYEAARQTLNNLIATFPSSQYLFNAKLAIAESRYRQGGPRGLALAQAEYRNLILFYPSMIEAARPLGEEMGILPRQTATPVPPPPSPPPQTGSKLDRISITGLSDSARADLLSRLPIQEGGEWSSQIFASVTAATKAFDSHLVAVLTRAHTGSLELHIGPAADFATPFQGTTVTFRNNPATVAPPAPIAPTEPLRVGNGVSPPSVRYRVDPEIPADATGGADMVMLSCVIDTNGKPVEIHVVKSSGQALDEKAVDAVTKWEFNPGMQNGVPVKVRATVEVHFRRL